MNPELSLQSIDIQNDRRKWLVVGDIFPDTTLIITGFGKKYLPREGLTYKHAGIYIDFCVIEVYNFATGVTTRSLRISPTHLGTSIYRAMYPIMRDMMVRIGDLPVTCIMPGDLVRFIGDNKRLLVTQLDYENQGEHPYPLYYCDIEQPDGRWFHCQEAYSNQEQLEVLERGNLFKFCHGMALSFSTIEDEAEFYQKQGFSHKVSCPNGVDLFLIADAINLLVQGQGSDIKIVDKKTLSARVIAYDVPGDFPERMRAHTLKRLGISI